MKGKPAERQGHKATGLRSHIVGRAAGLPVAQACFRPAPPSGCGAFFEVIVLTPLNESTCGLEATRRGAFHDFVKMEDDMEIIDPALREAINGFNETARLKATITDLKTRLVKRASGQHPGRKEEKPFAPLKRRSDLLQGITQRFRRGEINLPSYPQVNLRFRKLMQEGRRPADRQASSRHLSGERGLERSLIRIKLESLRMGREKISKDLDSFIRSIEEDPPS